ncbi:MAG TPA: phosphoethanolamine--lipid A transferase [Steroidobacteraceae bacterium]|nr:phosphoethanolamine--lipid A transferase [Steroidobacteraceae bacterium]
MLDTFEPSQLHVSLTRSARSPISHRFRPGSLLQEARGRLRDGDERLRAFLSASRGGFVLVVSAALLLLYNFAFWRESASALGGARPASVAFLVALGTILITLHALILFALPGRRTAPLVAAALFTLAATVAYFSNTYGVYFDHAMMRNIFESDRAEIHDLLRGKFFVYLTAFGALPASIAGRVVLPAQSWRSRLRVSAAALGGGLALVAMLALGFSAHLASYLREHKPLRYLINPANVVYGTVSYAIETTEGTRPFVDTEGRVERIAAAQAPKPLLVFLVVGETARAANFELDGYARPTNPRLRRMDDVVSFREVHSCGTSTATSVPCMFSHLGREAFDPDQARAASNLLDAVQHGGVSVEWRENNTGCKHLCERVQRVAYAGGGQGDCAGAHCFDAVMTEGLREQLRGAAGDTLIVFHQSGSHGPAYAERYPRSFETFTPVCRSADLGRCERSAVVNAYDNTIVYTDHVLAQDIELLKSLAAQYDSLLIYVSDHGESLGENGIYLHAAPYFIAPEEQTHVPLLMWMSEGYLARSQIDMACVRARAAQPASHDDLYHTVLAALGLRSDLYRRDLDLLGACRARW